MELEVGDKVYYDREVYGHFHEFLYNTKHIVTKIEYDALGVRKIFTRGDGWSYIPHIGKEELSTGDEHLLRAIKLCGDTKWQGSRILFHFV